MRRVAGDIVLVPHAMKRSITASDNSTSREGSRPTRRPNEESFEQANRRAFALARVSGRTRATVALEKAAASGPTELGRQPSITRATSAADTLYLY